jgi:hypothetical protein
MLFKEKFVFVDCVAYFTHNSQPFGVFLPVFLQLLTRVENASALVVESALNQAWYQGRVQIDVLLQVFSSKVMLSAQVALVTWRVIRRRLFKG